ncbi:sugar ABC transporter permease [Spirochaetia bacterium]|nr:sugar ABC transporter permease [Spirochaetia bacterium]
MKLLKRVLLAALALCCMTGIVFAGGGQGKSGSGGDRVTYWNQWIGPPNGVGPGDSEYFKRIQAETGVTIDFIASSGDREQLSILIAADSPPDIIEEWWGNFPGGITKSLSDGVIIPLNDLIKQGKLPGFAALLASDKEIDQLCKTDDGIYYMLPLVRGPGTYTAFNGMAIRQDWLDELGLAMPKTIDDWTNVLTQFKNRKGATSPVTGFWRNFEGMVWAYETMENFYVRNNRTVEYGFGTQNYLDYLTKMHEWYAAGLLDPDLFTQTDDEMNAKISTGKIGAAYTSIGSGFGRFEQLKPNQPGMNFVAAPNPMRNANTPFNVINSQFRVSNVSASISSNAKNIDAVCRVIDYPFTAKGIKLANYGVENVSYRVVNGVEEYTDLIKNNPNGYSMADAMSIYNGSGNKSFMQEKNQLVQQYVLQVQKDALNVWPTTQGAIRMMPPVTLTAAETSEYARIMSDIDTYVQEMKLKFIIGTEPLSNYPAFRSNLEKMNIARAAAIQQAAFDRFLKR